MLTALSLGATMYMPATRPELWDVVKGSKYPELRSLVICLEDAVSDADVEFAKANLKKLLETLKNEERFVKHPFLFVRPRNIEMAKELAEWDDFLLVDGVVLPKFGLDNLLTWNEVIPSNLAVMPTLESADVFDPICMRELRQALQQDYRDVLVLRIGGNDLLSCLSTRRPSSVTIYQTPLGQLIGNLCGQFLPYGFSLSSPVCEHFGQIKLLQDELEFDIQHGLSGKTIINPSQIAIVHQAYQVNNIEYEEAKSILNKDAKAVFSSNGSMLEPATHYRWAQRILERASIFGLKK